MSEPAAEQSIFLEALALPTPAERAAYLDEACRDRPELRAEVDALLAAHERLGGGLPPTTGPEAAAADADSAPGAAVAVGSVLARRYKLVQPIGEGGMGTVWMAQQTEPVKRLVALKLIKPGMDSKQVLVRFEAERQALALMDHPNIARVLDAGTTETGRPFFVMELVKGVPLTKYCDEQRLTPRQRLELFIPVCQAIQHAHQKGIIHRDIKPSNVLVAQYDGKPVPKVIDFGIAKATGQQLTEQTLVTGFGAVIGTLEYMSPEQAELNQLDIDTRSDIYALGVLLYELLTGTTPLERKRLKRAAVLEVLRLIREEEPPRPSTRLSTTDALPSVAANRGLEPKKLSGLVRGELDWIVMKALEKDRSRRYDTANGFAADVLRYLNDEPVQACPPRASYRLRKFVRRNRRSLTVVAVAVVVLVLATVVSTWQAIRATNASKAEREVRQGLDKALLAEKAALVKATTSAHIAEVNRRAAEESQKAMRIVLADMNTTHGLFAAERGKREQAVLWFANAARLAHADLQRATSNRVRVRNWGRDTLIPVAALSTAARLRTLAFHPRSDHLLVLTVEGECILWDVRKDEAMPRPGGQRTIGGAAWSPDGALLALGDVGGEVEVFAFPSGKALHRIAHRGAIRALAFNAGGDRLALASDVARVWDLRTQSFVAGELVHPQPVETLRFNAAGNRLVTGCRDNRARVFVVSDKKVGREPLFAAVTHIWWPNEQDPRYGSACGPVFVDGGRGLLTRENRAAAAWWDTDTGRLVRRLPAPGDWGIYTLAADPTGRYVALCGQAAEVWDTTTAQRVGAGYSMTHSIASASLTGDGRLLLMGSLDNTFRLWSLPERRLLAEKDLHEKVLATALSADGRLLAAATGAGKQFIRVWFTPPAGPPSPVLPLWSAPGSGGLLKMSRDGRYLVTFGKWWRSAPAGGGTTQVYEVATGKPVVVRHRAPGFVVAADFSPDGRRIALLTAGLDPEASPRGTASEVSSWDWQTGRAVFDRVAVPAVPNDLSYSPDGTHLAVIGNEGQVFLLDAATGETRGTFQSSAQKAGTAARKVKWHQVSFDPTGKHLLAWGKDNMVRVWEVGTGRRRTLTAKNTEEIFDVRFSADGLLCTSGGTVWEFTSGRVLAVLPSHPAMIFANKFSPDGQRIATACRDGMVRLWDWRTGRLVCPPFQHRREAWDIAFTPDGRSLATSSWDATVRLWDVQTGHPLAPALQARGSAWQLETDPGGHFLAVCGLAPTVPVFDLRDLCLPEELPVNDLVTWSELVADQRIHEGGNVVNLSPEEWLERWRSFRQRQPRHSEALWSTASRLPGRRGAAETGERNHRPSVDVQQLAPQTPQQVIATSGVVIAWMPLHAETYLRRGRAYFQLKQYRQAADDLGVAVGLNPDVNQAQVWFELGYACAQSGRPRQAHAAYSRTVALDARFDGAWNNRGLLHEQSGQLEQALDDFSKALAVNDRNAIAWGNRARLHERLGHWDAVIEDCTRFLVLAKGPQQADGFARRATAYARLGRYREALADYQKCLDVRPDNAPTLNALAWLLASCADTKLCDPGRAVELARRAIDLAPKAGNYWNTLGVAHYRVGDWKAAVAAFDKSMKLSRGGDPFDWFFLAMAYQKLGQPGEARKHYDRATQWMEKNGAALAGNPQLANELRRFRSEAEQVLERKKKR